jgi:hypothetical protein
MRNGFTTIGMAANLGLCRRSQLERECQRGSVPGAIFDRLTWQWWVPLSMFTAIAQAFGAIRS